MNKKSHIAFLILWTVIVQSCTYFQLKDSKPKDSELAKVGNVVLYRSDLNDLFHPNMSSDDSLKIASNFIESWARRQIILQKAQFNLSSDEESDLEQMIKRYREDLYINAYKAAIVSQNIDTIISNTEIKNYYMENNQIFNLNEDLLKYRLISFQSNDKKANKIKELFKKNDSISIDELYKGEYIFQNFQINDSLWIKYPEFINKYPFSKILGKEQFLQPNSIMEIKEGNITNYIYIKSVLRRGEIAPLLFIQEDIVKMIIHQRKLKYLQDLENKLINEAIQNKTYEKY